MNTLGVSKQSQTIFATLARAEHSTCTHSNNSQTWITETIAPLFELKLPICCFATTTGETEIVMTRSLPTWSYLDIDCMIHSSPPQRYVQPGDSCSRLLS